MTQNVAQGHLPVMIDEVLAALPSHTSQGLVVDMTFGGGGYTKQILDKTNYTVLGLDRDPQAIKRGAVLQAEFPQRLHLVETVFSELDSALVQAGLATQASLDDGKGVTDAIILDLGVSSFQLDAAERGFSFRFDGPLDMRMGADGKTAQDVIGTYDEQSLADIFWRYGEEKLARRMAAAIVLARKQAPITKTSQLVDILHKVRARRHNDRIDPATRVFQALRIEVNNELGEIDKALDKAIKLLKPGGVVVAVSFHSLEDRIIKKRFQNVAGKVRHVNKYRADKKSADTKDYKLPFRGVVKPTLNECETNPRARSAKMRVLRKKQREE